MEKLALFDIDYNITKRNLMGFIIYVIEIKNIKLSYLAYSVPCWYWNI